MAITQVSAESITIHDATEYITIKPTEFHKWFYLGFCITIHASQGETFHDRYTIHDWNFKYFCEKARYVAFSRGTNIDNIQIKL